ncbi:hypothetical protein SBA3_1170031 [Candidatus Sulfopaludibacter sp. SbA3]|nr:hypothetical protein SBA3_1170031 [Candidatus Sulfopaludibacter sp. SbA3]
MLQILKRRGFQKPAWFTPAEFAASLPRTAMGERVAEFTITYNALRFGGRTEVYNALRFGGRTEVATQLSALLDELERQDHS